MFKPSPGIPEMIHCSHSRPFEERTIGAHHGPGPHACDKDQHDDMCPWWSAYGDEWRAQEATAVEARDDDANRFDPQRMADLINENDSATLTVKELADR